MLKKSLIALAAVALSFSASAAPNNAKLNKNLSGLKHRVEKLESHQLTVVDDNGSTVGNVMGAADSIKHSVDPSPTDSGAVWVAYEYFYEGEWNVTQLKVSRWTIRGKFDYAQDGNTVFYTGLDCTGEAVYGESPAAHFNSTVFLPPVVTISGEPGWPPSDLGLVYVVTGETYEGEIRSLRRPPAGECTNDLSLGNSILQAGDMLQGGALMKFVSDVYQEFTPPFRVK